MKSKKEIDANLEFDLRWDERELGASAEHAKLADNLEALNQRVDDSLELQMISIRLPKGLIENFKLLAEANGLGYQPLMRIALTRFAECEMKRLIETMIEEKKKAGVSSPKSKRKLQAAA